jgi:predicted nucleic acid-binding Zn ribbon protein
VKRPNYRHPEKRELAKLQAIAEWRKVHLEHQEKAARSNTQEMGSLVPQLMNSLGIEEKLSDAEIVKVWNQQLDPAIVKHAQPVGLNKGTLFVDVSNSSWLNEIVRYRRKEILQRLHHSFGKDRIKRISFRAGG